MTNIDRTNTNSTALNTDILTITGLHKEILKLKRQLDILAGTFFIMSLLIAKLVFLS